MGGQGGNALVGAMAFMVALAALGWGHLRSAAYEAESVRGRFEDMKVRWEAEAALSKALAHLGRLPSPGDTSFAAQDTGKYPSRYRIRKMNNPAFPRWLITAYIHDGSFGDPVLCSLSAVSQSGTAAAKYFHHDHDYGGSYYFTGDTIDGPIHTNTRFAIAGSPVFLDKVFEMGGGIGQGFITHPEYQTAPILVKAKPKQGAVYRFDHMSQWIRKVEPSARLRADPGQVMQIVFKGKDMEIRARDRTLPDAWTPAVTRRIPEAGGLFVEGEVEVKGVLGRKLTMGASGNIIITDDLVYADSDPVTAKPREASDIYLGLISEKNVNVKQVQTQDTRGRGIRINAAVVAMDKSFQVTNYRAHSWDMGTMRFWGTITQYSRGAIGSVKANDNFRGYHKDWHYDRRFEKDSEALPYFPPLLTSDGLMDMAPIWYGRLDWVDADV